MTKLAISGLVRPLLEPQLPDDVDVRWFMTKEEAVEAVADAEIGWFDMNEKDAMAETLVAAKNLKWLNSIYAGLDFLPMDVLIERGITVTNGAGINAITIAEYVVMGMLNIAKGYREVVRAQERRERLGIPPGDPIVACGDFNVLPGSETFRVMTRVAPYNLVTLRGYDSTRTSHYPKANRWADYMLVNGPLKNAPFEVVSDPEISDHCPLVIETA